MASIIGILVVLVASLIVGSRGVRALRGTGDFLVASRSIGTRANATAVAGEYLSAASFLGVAGAVMKIGIGGMWYPIGFTAGYVTLLVLVAAPLRRFGGYTVPDFVEGRLGSLPLRRLIAGVAFVISGLYVVPQLKGAGLILSDAAAVPYPIGVAATAAVIAGIVVVGGMRSATYLQAFEYAVKIACVAVPAVVLLIALHPAERSDVVRLEGTRFATTTAVTLPAHTALVIGQPTAVEVDGVATTLPTGPVSFAHRSRVVFAAGERVPAVSGQAELGGSTWQRPLISLPGVGHPLYLTLSIVLTFALGTAGLPHILVRFGTNTTGRDSRRTAVGTVGLIGFFYLFPALYGLIGRALAPQLYLTGGTDSVVAVLPGLTKVGGGGVLSAMTSAGAFAAFLSTSAGLLLTAGSAISHDIVRRDRARLDSIPLLRWGVVGATVIAAMVSLAARDIDISICVSWAFSLAVSTITPLLVLGIWSDRLTPAGAAAGVVSGGVLASAAVLLSLTSMPHAGWWAALLSAPAPVSLTVAVVVMLAVSSRTGRTVPRSVSRTAMARMHRLDPVE
jgi:cation/acetate symporter